MTGKRALYRRKSCTKTPCSVLYLVGIYNGNKKAFEASKAAYDNIDIAYEISEQFGEDIYEAWRLGIYDDDEILKDGVKHLAKELNLTEDELIDGIVYTISTITGDKEYEAVLDEDKQKLHKLSRVNM